MKIIKIEVGAGGEIKILYQGFEGEQCFVEASKLYTLLKQYGIEVNILRSELTDEYYTASSSSVEKEAVKRGL
jgi:hypothetical protein